MVSTERLCITESRDGLFETGTGGRFLHRRSATVVPPFIDDSVNFLLAIAHLTLERIADIAHNRAASFAASEGRFRETADSISIFSMEYNIIFCVMPHICGIMLSPP